MALKMAPAAGCVVLLVLLATGPLPAMATTAVDCPIDCTKACKSYAATLCSGVAQANLCSRVATEKCQQVWFQPCVATCYEGCTANVKTVCQADA